MLYYTEDLFKAIRTFAENPDRIDNFEAYVTRHEENWYNKFANDVEGLINELEIFSNVEDC